MNKDIRSFHEKDREAVLAILNADMPVDRTMSVDEWRQLDRALRGDEVWRRMVVGDPAVAYLEIMDMGTTHSGWRSISGICEMELVVAAHKRNAGLGAALYEQALSFARERGAQTLRCWFYQTSPQCPMMRFLTAHGFAEQAQRQLSSLDLVTFDQRPFAAARQEVEKMGVRILTYADMPDSAENRLRLYDLLAALGSVTPGDSFATWTAQNMEGKDWAENLLLVAELDGAWIGLSQLGPPDQDSGACEQHFTGTLEAFRGRSIATALKLQGYEKAAQRGCRMITTSNRVNNIPMLAINRKLGFVPGPIEWSYDKPILSGPLTNKPPYCT